MPNLSYANDIKPKFRATDYACMKPRGVLLDDPKWMCDAAGSADYPDHANARKVFDYVSDQSMPPDAPWPQNWIDQYQNWMNGGFDP